MSLNSCEVAFWGVGVVRSRLALSRRRTSLVNKVKGIPRVKSFDAGAFGTYNALRLAKTKKARFLFASTSEVYGDPKVHPQTESYWGNVNPIGPRSAYYEAKRFAEALVIAYYRHDGLDVRIARIFNTYGPGMRPHDGRVVSNFITQALRGEKMTVFGDGNQTRSLCYLSDMVDGLIRLVLANPDSLPSHGTFAEDTIHEPINLGNPEEMKVKDLAQPILRLTGSSSQIEERSLPADDPKMRCPDITRAQKLLGWQPKVSLQEGLKSTIEYFRQEIRKGGDSHIGRFTRRPRIAPIVSSGFSPIFSFELGDETKPSRWME